MSDPFSDCGGALSSHRRASMEASQLRSSHPCAKHCMYSSMDVTEGGYNQRRGEARLNGCSESKQSAWPLSERVEPRWSWSMRMVDVDMIAAARLQMRGTRLPGTGHCGTGAGMLSHIGVIDTRWSAYPVLNMWLVKAKKLSRSSVKKLQLVFARSKPFASPRSPGRCAMSVRIQCGSAG